MKTVFMGTPAFVAPVLSALLDASHQVVGVYTQPDRPAGRGKRPEPPPLKRLAQELGLPVLQPLSLRPRRVQEELAMLQPEVVVVAGYGLLLPPRVLDTPPLGCLNVHPSLLPKYRGATPVQTTILNGDDVAGVTVFKMDQGMDTGPVLAGREVDVRAQEYAPDLAGRLFKIGAAVLTEVLPRWAGGEIEAVPQADSEATVTKRLSREDGQIDWLLGATRIARQVRAYHPWPGSYTRWRGMLLKITEAYLAPQGSAAASAPGLVLSPAESGVSIAAGDGVLEVRRLQLEGRRAVDAREFVRGHPDFVGSALGS